MTPTLMFWMAVAIVLFWSVGAYNRLVRLRAEANAAFAALEVELNRQLTLIEACLPAGEGQPASRFDDDVPSFWGGLQGAATQFAASLSAARHRPLDPEGIGALRAARDVLSMAWERAERDDAHDLAGPRLPDSVTATRIQMMQQATAAGAQFSQAVERYNRAIAQFPALLLAWLFGFRPGQAL